MGRWVFTHTHVMVTLVGEHLHSTCPSFVPQLLLLSTLPCSIGYLFGQLALAVPAVSPSNFLCTLSLLTGEAA